MALDLLEYNVRVNCVCPGHVDNEFFLAAKAIIAEPWREQEILASQPASIQKKIMERLAALRDNPVGRASMGRGFNGTPQELANAIVFLASDEASFINGECLVVDGGSSAGK
ncbi:MAG TPA: SDR family oxidoreductase [Firmicutes bacterium]|nr:SDR family oxidoreductase [Candidatus Fermentithermobacillaceae bacterium]